MNNYHLTKDGDNWKLKQQGADRSSKVFEGTKEDSVREAAKFLENQPQPSSLKIHKLDGTIEEERTYPGGADPSRSKG